MKSLVESLFDKDLVEKDLPSFGSKYSVHCVLVSDDAYSSGGQSYATRDDEYNWLLHTVKLANLKRDFKNPIKIDNKKGDEIDGEYILGWRADEKFCDVIGYIVSAMNTLPLDSELQYYKSSRSQELRKKLDPYLKNMNGNIMAGTGGSYYFGKRGTGECMFTLYRKDRKFIIIFDEKK